MRSRALIVTDQFLTSLNSLALSLFVARVSTVGEFGAFGVGMVLYLIGVGVVRPFGGDVMLVFGARDFGPRRKEAPTVLAAAVASAALGVVVGLVLTAVGLAMSGSGGTAVVLIGVSFPVVTLVELSRLAHVSAGQPTRAAALSGSWLGIFVVSVLVAQGLVDSGPATVTAAWAASGVLVGLVAIVSAVRTWNRPSVVEQYRPLLAFCGRYAADFLLMTGAAQGALLLVAAMSGFAGAAGLRGAQTLLGPANVALMAAATAILARGGHASRSQFRGALVTGAVMMAGVWLYVAIALGLPGSVGEAVLGASWSAAREALVPLGLAAGFSGLALAATTSLRARAMSKVALHTRIVLAPLSAAFVLLTAFATGTMGGLWAYALSCAIGAVVWFTMLQRQER